MKLFSLLSSATGVSFRPSRRGCFHCCVRVCSSQALTAPIYSKALLLKRTGQERPLECNRLKYNFAVSYIAA